MIITIILTLILLVSISYAITFKNDVPPVLVKRTIVFLVIAFTILNLGMVLEGFKKALGDILQ